MSVEVPTPNLSVDDPPRNKDSDAKETSMSKPIFEAPKPYDDEDLFDEIMFKDDNTTVCAILVRSSLSMLQKSSSSKAHFDFGHSSSSDESEENEIQGGNKITYPCLETPIDGDQENPKQGDQNNNDKRHNYSGDDDDDDFNDKKYEISSSDTRSSDDRRCGPIIIKQHYHKPL